MKPRDLAEKIIAALPADENVTKAEIAGPGFINFFQNTQALADRLDAALADAHLGVRKAGAAQRTVVDLSAPNLAKEMHVGHLRSTIIGDGVAACPGVPRRRGDPPEPRRRLGHPVRHADGLPARKPRSPANELSDLENFYRAAKQRFDESEAFADRARGLVVKLQAGDAECLALWTRFKDISLSHCQKIYELLNVKLSHGRRDGRERLQRRPDQRGQRPEGQAGMLVESNGAQCVFLDEFKNADGDPLPVIIVKADGGYLYATTDLAAVRYRSGKLKADRALYFVDQRQALHFQQVFAVARKAGFVTHPMEMEHMGFGTMNGADGRPFKTRDGGTVKLIDLLDRSRGTRLQPGEREEPDAGRSRAAQHRQSRRHRRGEIRRPVQAPHQRLQLQLRPDAQLRRQYRAIPAVRLHPRGRCVPQTGQGLQRSRRSDRSAKPSTNWSWRRNWRSSAKC